MSAPNSGRQTASGALPDAAPGQWLFQIAPPRLRPYLQLARVDRPIGWWLLLLPCWWSSALAAVAAGRSGPDIFHIILFWIGAIAMRGAGSAWNDLVDRDLDGRVERTRSRPLPSGQVTPRQAALFLVGLALIGLAVLLSFNRFAILVGFCSLLPVAIYPFMKRITSFPQIVLGIAFAWGGLMGWAAAFGRLDAPAYLIYAAAIAWTFGYDTIYALQDIEDDALVGIGSTARFFGDSARRAIALSYAATLLLAGAAFLGDGDDGHSANYPLLTDDQAPRPRSDAVYLTAGKRRPKIDEFKSEAGAESSPFGRLVPVRRLVPQEENPQRQQHDARDQPAQEARLDGEPQHQHQHQDRDHQ